MEKREEAASEANATESTPDKSGLLAVEKLFPFVRKARAIILGRETLERSKSRLQFLLITTDISANSKEAMFKQYEHYPVVQCYTSAELEKHFGCTGTKVIGFAKGDLSKSVYQGLKQFRINKPATGSNSIRTSLKPEQTTNEGSASHGRKVEG